MSNISSKPKLLTRLALGLITSLPWEKSLRRLKPVWFEKWDDQPKSTREGWKRIWIVGASTTIMFLIIATTEYLVKKPIQHNVQEKNQIAEECPINISFPGIYCLIVKSELLNMTETFSIVVAASLFILDKHTRIEQSHREDWSLIDGARGSETSGARYSALERLHEEKVSLKGLDAEGADLQGINLEDAILERSNLQEANLQKANLQRANLQKANLKDAILEESNLEGANLWLADLRGANLRGANLHNSRLGAVKLHRAILRKADLKGADLRGARFYDVDFRDTNFENADLKRAEFVRPKNLTLEQVMKAKEWPSGKFSKEWNKDNLEIPRNIKKDSFSDGSKTTRRGKKLHEIREIENLIDYLSQKRHIPKDEFYSYLQNESFELPEVKNLRDLITSLEDIHEKKQREIEDIIEDTDQELNILKNHNKNIK